MLIHILGKGDGWEAIKEVPKGEIVYGCNDAFLRTPTVTHTFHMHDLEAFYKDKNTHSSTKLCVEHIKDHPEMEFYTVKAWDMIPTAKEYPLQEVVKRFGTCYFTSSIEYMIAYALMKGATKLKFYGINMTVKQEYIDQKPGVEFWLGMAKGMGVEYELQHEYTSLMKTRDGLLYGYLINQWRV